MHYLRSRHRLALLALVASATAGCDGTVSVRFSTGPQEFEVSTAELSLPTELDDGSGRIESVMCGPMGMCPPSDEVTLDCNAGVCDPAPRTISAPVGGVVDVDELLADTREIGLRVVDSYEFEMVAYEILLNTLTVPIGEIEVYWGPEAATSIDPALGVRRFGTIPAIPAGSTAGGTMIIDGVGAGELSDFLTGGGGNGRIRFFAQTTVDLDPGDPFPDGAVRMSVNITVRAVGSVLD